MGLLADISADLVNGSIGTAGTAASQGWSIYQGKITASPDQQIGLFEYGGMPPEMNHDKATDVNPSLQVRVRATQGGYTTGIAKAEAILARLHQRSNTTINSVSYKLIRAMSSPIFIGVDDKGRPEWTINFQIVKAP